jgi:hypothetical protein
VAYVRGSLFAGEEFLDLADAQRKAEVWCGQVAGQRIHGTTGLRPAVVFAGEEAPLLLPGPVMPYDVPLYAHPKVHRDGHCEVARAIYSVPYRLRGSILDARVDSVLVKFYHRGQLVKVHPRQRPGRRITDAADLPAGKAIYATRDTQSLLFQARMDGDAVGAFAARLLDCELPWTRMRQVYRLLGLARRYGSDRLDDACAKALEIDCVDVGVVARMLERVSAGMPETPAVPQRLPLRFARQASEWGGDR